MKVELRIDPGCDGMSVVINAPALTDEMKALAVRLEGGGILVGWQGGWAVPLAAEDIFRCYGGEKSARCQTPGGVYDLKERLYELEGQLDRYTLIRIPHSEIISLRKITALDLSLTDTIRMTLESGAMSYVPRRYMRKIKEALGLQKGGNDMLFDDKGRALRRALVGALLGMAGGGLAAWAAGSLIAGSPNALALAFLNCGFPRGLEGVRIALSFALCALFGTEVGAATLPFAGDGSALVGRTLVHSALTAVTVELWVGLNFGVRETAASLVPLALVYLLVWLGRWMGWYAEMSAIREQLGLAPGPSLFYWRETLPYIPFAALLCLLLPLALRLYDAGDVPVFSGPLYPYLLLPADTFCSALSLGKRQGFCPLYPVVCTGFPFCFALLARLVSNVADADILPIAFLAALAGGSTGAALRWRRGDAGE